MTVARSLLLLLAGSLGGCAATSTSSSGGAQETKDVSAASDGATVYTQSCAACHGDGGKGGSAKRIAGHPA
jgi:mono/diheme cytochrome c family protein